MADAQVQPKIVQVPSIGNIQFPGDMSDDQISAAIQKNYPQLAKPSETPASMLTAPQQMDRAVNRDYGQPSMSAGTQTFDQAHPSYAKTMGPKGALARFAEGAGIPTSQAETTEAMQALLSPQPDPNETSGLIRTAEQIPVIGGDVRARAALAKRAARETGAIAIAHKAAAMVPFVGPAVTAAQDKYDQGDIAGTIGASVNAYGAAEGLKGAVKPKPTVTEGSQPATAINQPELPAQPGTLIRSIASGDPITRAVNKAISKISAAPVNTTSKILGGGPESMAKKPLAGATAAGKASNADVAAYAASKGIDLLPGQATGARGLQTIQAIGERAVVAPGELPEVLDKQKAAFGDLVDDFKTRVGTEAVPNTEAAGQSLKSQAEAGLNNLKNSAQSDYQAFQNQAGDIPVDLSDVKSKAAASLASQAEALKNVPAQYANPVRNVLKKLSDLQAGGEADPRALADFNNAVDTYGLNPEQQSALRTKLGLPDENGNSAVKMSTAQQLRSAYLDISRDYTGNVPKSVQRYAGQAAKDIDAAMAKAADQVGATDQWRQANAKWKQLQQTYNNPEHPLYKVLQEPDPSKVPSRLLGKGNYGGSPQTVRQLQQAGIDVSPLKREVAQQIADRNFALTNGGRGLAGYSSDFLKTLFNPAEFDELTKMGRVGRAIKFEMNPSGTSNVMEGHRQLRDIIHGTLGAVVGPGASRLTTSKALARAAMGDITPPRSLVDILGSRGPEPPPELPPSNGAPSTPNPAPGTPPAPKARGVAAAPRSLSDILSGKPPVDPTGAVAARLSELRRELLDAKTPEGKADIQQAIGHLQAVAKGEPFHAPEQAAVENLPATQPREIEPGTYNRETKVHTPGKPQSVASAVHDVLGQLPSPQHKPTKPQEAMETGVTVAGNYGNDTAVKTTTGSLPAKYKVVEADSLIPSHNAQTFAKNPQYPEGVQERDYARSKEAQNRVIQQAQNYDPAYTVNTNPDAVNGPPVVTKDGIVLGGNSRTMSTQRLYKAGSGDAYRADLTKNAAQFGVSPEQIAGMKQPILVREVETPANIEQARRIGADLNKNMTGAMGTGEKAVSAGRSVKPQTLATISGMVNDLGEGATLRDVMRQNGKDIASMMVKDGVISDRERPQFIDTSNGGLNEEGKTFIERALMGSVVDDPRLMDRVPKSVMGKLEGSLGDLATIGARSDEYNLMPIVREALNEHAEMAMRGLDVNKYLAQGSMFGQAGNPAVEAMTRTLAEKPKAFREAMQQYAQDAKFDSQGQGLLGIMGKKPSAAQAFNDAFGTRLTDEQFHDALLQSYKKEGTIGPDAGQEAGNPKAGGNLRQDTAPATRPGPPRGTAKAKTGEQAADQQDPVGQRSLSDILSGKPEADKSLGAKPKGFKRPKSGEAGSARMDIPSVVGEGAKKLADTFFSKAERTAEEKLPNTINASQVIPTLQNAGVKAEELKWLGLDDYLKGKDKVSKADLLNQIRQNNVQVKEVVKGAPTPEWKLENGQFGQDADQYFVKMPNGKTYRVGKGTVGSETEAKEYLQRYLTGIELEQEAKSATKFSQYQLPGGENYRELLLTLPEDLIRKGEGPNSPVQRFRSSHFDEPNVLAHVRFNDRISPDGKKTLFMEELQSDWHQKGRKEGYQRPELTALPPEYKISRVPRDDRTNGERYILKGADIPDGERVLFASRNAEDLTADATQDALDYLNLRAKAAVPDAPFKTTWHELAMKRMLRYAAENAYDQLAWTTGEQQAARYDLSKQVEALEWNTDTNRLYAQKKGASDHEMDKIADGVTEKNLADYVGKEAAQKLLEQQQEGSYRRLSGVDLKVGGRGMAGFYDKILPEFLNKYGKKWGAKVGETTLDLSPTGSANKVKGDFEPVHSIPITPSMKHDVLYKGQPISKNEPRSLMRMLSGVNS